MPLLRFHNPSDLPCYGGYDFRVEPSVITVRAEDMRDVYARYLENHQKYHSRIPKHWPRNQEAIEVAAKHRELVEACDEGRDVASDSSNYLWSFVSSLMFERRFVSAVCPVCGQSLKADECAVVEWAFGEDLAAYGGRRVVCPRGHTLYACPEWNS